MDVKQLPSAAALAADIGARGGFARVVVQMPIARATNGDFFLVDAGTLTEATVGLVKTSTVVVDGKTYRRTRTDNGSGTVTTTPWALV